MKYSIRDFALLLILAIALGFATVAEAQTESVLYRFTGYTDGDGGFPTAGLIADQAGNLYGTTSAGGPINAGTVFELSPPTTNGDPWTETVLYAFTEGTDGGSPSQGSLVFDREGNLYGATTEGGTPGNPVGVVFKLTPPSTEGGAWAESVLYSFGANETDGKFPQGSLVFDSAGNLYGTTYAGGAGQTSECSNGCGTVFQLTTPVTSTGAWRKRTIHDFFAYGGNDGAGPGPVLVGPEGVLFGYASGGGSHGGGIVFKLFPPATAGARWVEKIIYAFPAFSEPSALTLGSDGTLFGATGDGVANGGTVFRLKPPASGSVWTESILSSFGAAGLTFDDSGNIYGTTALGGDRQCARTGCGTVFQLSPPTGGSGIWTRTTLYNFEGGSDGSTPFAGPVWVSGALFGTTLTGGTGNNGTVFEVLP